MASTMKNHHGSQRFGLPPQPKLPPPVSSEGTIRTISTPTKANATLLSRQEKYQNSFDKNAVNAVAEPQKDPTDHFNWTDDSTDGDRPTKRQSTGTYQDDELLKGLEQEDECLVLSNDDDMGNLYQAMGTWKPFVDKVANYLMDEKLPFDYFDIWVPVTSSPKRSKAEETEEEPDQVGSTSTTTTTTTTTSPDSCSSSSLRLRHVGHGTNGAAELSSILTMYQMNQFGNWSEKYSFPPGVGLPGRVFRAQQPMWDFELQQAPFRDFPRTRLAKRFGLKQGVAIPLVLGEKDQKTCIIAMYATNCTPRDDVFVQKAYEALLGKTPPNNIGISIPPPLKLTPQLKDSTSNGDEKQSTTTAAKKDDGGKEQHPSSDDNDNDDQQHNNQSILPDDTEVEMAHLLGRYYNSGNNHCYPLACLLWRAPCNRTKQENQALQQLKNRFRTLSSYAAPQEDVAATICTEWETKKAQSY